MNRFTLPSLALFLSLASSPLALSAQAQAASSALYAESEAPAFSSSNPLPAAPAARAAAAASAAAAPESAGVRPFSAVAVAVKFGIAGPGFDLAVPLVQRLNLRGGASFFSYSPNLTIDGANLSGAIEFQNAALMLDVFPFNNRFRLSAGTTVYNNTSLNATLTYPSGTSFTLGSTTYTSDPAKPASGTASFNFGSKVVPRFTFGIGNMLPKRGHWVFETETGIEYIGQPTVTYAINGYGCTGAGETSCGPVSQSSVNQQQTDLQNDLSLLRFYPVMSFGFSYKIGSSR